VLLGRRRRSRDDAPSLAALLERWSGLTAAGVCVLVVAVVGYVLARKVGGRAVYLLVYAGIVIVIAAVVSSRRRRRLEAVRSQLPTRMRVGQSADVEITVTSDGRLRAFVVEEHLSGLLSDPVRVQVPTVGKDDPFVHTYTIRPALRGVYQLGPLAAEWSDPFGLARHQQELTGRTEIIVHPSTEAIFDRPLTRMWEDPPFRPPVSKPWPQGYEFYGMRDYVPGDDPRRIVWSATARTRRYLVRESEQGITDRVTILIDNGEKVHSPGLPSETFELGVRAVASLGTHNLKQGYSVSLASNDAVLAPDLRGGRARITLLDHLARLELSNASLLDAVERQLGQRRGDSHLCIVTPQIDAATSARIRMLTDRGMSLVIALLAWDDADPNASRRAREVGAQVVQVRAGDQLESVFAHSLGLARR
jgi:uncharacterized protein (DUF58 family)